MAKKEVKTAAKTTAQQATSDDGAQGASTALVGSKAEAHGKAKAKLDSEVVAHQEGTFTKQQFLAAKQFRAQRDLLHALLAEDTRYTTIQVQNLIEGFLKKEAN